MHSLWPKLQLDNELLYTVSIFAKHRINWLAIIVSGGYRISKMLCVLHTSSSIENNWGHVGQSSVQVTHWLKFHHAKNTAGHNVMENYAEHRHRDNNSVRNGWKKYREITQLNSDQRAKMRKIRKRTMVIGKWRSLQVVNLARLEKHPRSIPHLVSEDEAEHFRFPWVR